MCCTASNCAAWSRLSRCPDVCRDEAREHSEQPGVSPCLWMRDFEMYFFLFSVIGSPVISLGFLVCECVLLPLFSRHAPLRQPVAVLVRAIRIQLCHLVTRILGIRCLTCVRQLSSGFSRLQPNKHVAIIFTLLGLAEHVHRARIRCKTGQCSRSQLLHRDHSGNTQSLVVTGVSILFTAFSLMLFG